MIEENQNACCEGGACNVGDNKGCDCKMCQKFGWCPAGKWHKIAGIILVILVIIFIGRAMCGGHGGGFRSDIQKDIITVSGKGEIKAVPDIAKISFTVTVENKEVALAQAEADAKMNSITALLTENGVDKKDIKSNYSINPRYDYVKTGIDYYGGKQVLAAYVVTETVEVTIRKIADSGKILAEVGKLGVTDVSGLSFQVDKEDALKLEAREIAIKDARAQAAKLAKSLGVRLVKITSFSEGGNYPVYYDMAMSSKAMGAAPSAAAPEIFTGENTITSNVTITYEIR